MCKIDIIIPTYKPDKGFFDLVDSLCRQTAGIRKIIVMNTEEKYYEALIYGERLSRIYKEKVRVYHLSKREFDHGGTRHKAVCKSDADIFVTMTQDAFPVDDTTIEKLVEALADERTAAAYARQVPKEGCSLPEQYTRNFNYPPQAHVMYKEDLERCGIRTYFCSNVCAAYKRGIYDDLGGFVRHTIFNEDMIYAAAAIREGYGIAYAADAQVYHSHNYTVMQQFHRNFDLGVSQAQHPEVFRGVPPAAEGKKMVGEVTMALKREKRWKNLIYFYVQCAFKYAGFLLGKRYFRLPRALVMKCTGNREYWKG